MSSEIAAPVAKPSDYKITVTTRFVQVPDAAERRQRVAAMLLAIAARGVLK